MLYDEPRDSLIENLIKEIRHHAHPAALAVPDQTCDICDTEALRQTLEGYSDDLLHTLVSHQRWRGTMPPAHEGKMKHMCVPSSSSGSAKNSISTSMG
jgi:hypothetical protein